MSMNVTDFDFLRLRLFEPFVRTPLMQLWDLFVWLFIWLALLLMGGS